MSSFLIQDYPELAECDERPPASYDFLPAEMRPRGQADPDGNLEKNRPPAPPQGYSNWLDYAVESMDTRTAFLELCVTDGESAPSRESMKAAVQHELQELRKRAGELYKSS